MANTDKGLYRKYIVSRGDGRDFGPNSKHGSCQLFVLDYDHDPAALPALRAYSAAVRKLGYEPLADDLDREIALRDNPEKWGEAYAIAHDGSALPAGAGLASADRSE